jgi:hypothetical protein
VVVAATVLIGIILVVMYAITSSPSSIGTSHANSSEIITNYYNSTATNKTNKNDIRTVSDLVREGVHIHTYSVGKVSTDQSFDFAEVYPTNDVSIGSISENESSVLKRVASPRSPSKPQSPLNMSGDYFEANMFTKIVPESEYLHDCNITVDGIHSQNVLPPNHRKTLLSVAFSKSAVSAAPSGASLEGYYPEAGLE